ncbi:hypothetical protein CPC08DRAFT_766606 [Agrocybe pediades]|nr:hypothetical protein CPC08DRAFT_766606 [Agrocybe pediades]
MALLVGLTLLVRPPPPPSSTPTFTAATGHHDTTPSIAASPTLPPSSQHTSTSLSNMLKLNDNTPAVQHRTTTTAAGTTQSKPTGCTTRWEREQEKVGQVDRNEVGEGGRCRPDKESWDKGQDMTEWTKGRAALAEWTTQAAALWAR